MQNVEDDRDFAVGSSSRWPCSDFTAVNADMHDGDQKEVVVTGTSMTITPSGNSESWVVNAVFDPREELLHESYCHCSAHMYAGSKKVLEIADPSGTIASPYLTLNHWLPVGAGAPARLSFPCLQRRVGYPRRRA